MVRLFPFVLVLLTCGCTTHTHHVFHGRMENLAGDGWIEEGTRAIGGMSSIPSQNGGRLLSMSLDPAVSFVLRHPVVEPEKTLHAQSSNGELRAWLIRKSRPLGGPLRPTSLSKEFDLSAAVPLKGEMELDWRNNLDFVLRVDVRSEGINYAALRGQFEARHEREFDPNMVWAAPAMMMGIGMATTTSRHVDPSKDTDQGTLALVDQQIQRIMKNRKRHRSFCVKIPSTGECIDFSNGATLLDKTGVQMQGFGAKGQDERLAALKAVCAETRLRLRIIPMENEESIALIDIYGEPPAVAGTAKAILKGAFGVKDATPLEFIRMD